jgi:hypothetical protein
MSSPTHESAPLQGSAVSGDEAFAPPQSSTAGTSVAVPAYDAGPIRRRRASHSQMAERYSALYDIVREHQPTGIRFVYYTATVRGIVPKTDSGYVKVQRAILQMRRDGVLDWSWVVDTNRWMRKPETWNSVEEALTEAANLYRRALWAEADTAVEVWCESDSVAGVLYPVTSQWDVPLYPIKGQTSDSFAWGAAQQYALDDRGLLILYIGDHDPAGYEIETNLHAKIIEHSGRNDIEWSRLACTEADVVRLALSGTPAKKSSWRDAMTGARHAWRGAAVEIEAIAPTILRQWLSDAIEAEVDHHALAILRVAEESERDILLTLAANGGVQ